MTDREWLDQVTAKAGLTRPRLAIVEAWGHTWSAEISHSQGKLEIGDYATEAEAEVAMRIFLRNIAAAVIEMDYWEQEAANHV